MKRVMSILVMLLFVASAQAVVVDNYSFEDGVTGWTGTDGDGGTGTGDFYGVLPPDGNAYYWLGESHVVYQTTDEVLTAGSSYELTVAVRNTWNANPQIGLYYTDDGGATRTTIGSAFYLNTDYTPNDMWDAFYDLALTVVIPGEAAGQNLGIELNVENPPGTWAHFDDVRLVPEPATLSLLGLGALTVLRRKRK